MTTMRIPIIILLLMLAVTTSSSFRFQSTWPVQFGFCANPPIKQGFRSNEFFNNKWYIWRGFGNLFFDGKGTCAGIDTKIVGNRVEFLHFQYEPLISQYLYVKGEADVRDTSFEGLRFPVDFKMLGMNMTMPFSVIGTDYENWAVGYFCEQQFAFKIEMAWILTRDSVSMPNSEHLLKIKESVATIGIEYEDFKLQDLSHCGGDEPHL